MYQILEIAPGIVFVASYFVVPHFFPEAQPIYWATGLFMIALVIQFMICLIFKLKISKLMWVVLVVGITAGAITIVFQAPIIIKWRPTVISWAMSTAFLTTHVFGRKNILKWLLEDYVQLSDRLWNYQTLVLGIVFLLSGTTNIVVAYSFSEETWVIYKVVAWVVWPVLSAILLGIVFWVENKRTGGAIFEQDTSDTNDSIAQNAESSERDWTQ
ncbi:MAG: septation protein IspZ [Gammaproteobacteria bacterium]|nr:septation protein IspZ [Gammaproteobacteria bacterium]